MQFGTPALRNASADLDADFVSPCGAGRKLVKQLRQLRRAWNHLISAIEPVSQQIGLAHSTQALESLDHRRRSHQQQVLRGHLQQYRLGLPRVRGAAGKGIAKLRKSGLQRWQQPGPDAVAGELLVSIARVFDPANPTLCEPTPDVCRAHRQQRPVVAEPCALPGGWHGAQARQTTAPAQGQQKRLNLIVSVLRNCYIFSSCLRIFIKRYSLKSLITSTPCRSLRTLTWCVTAIDPFQPQWHAKLCTKSLAMPLEIIGRSLQTMVNVNRMNLTRPFFSAGQQQRGGISAATECHRERQAWSEGSNGVGQRRRHTLPAKMLSARRLFGRGLGVSKPAVALQAFIATFEQIFDLKVGNLTEGIIEGAF